MPATCHSRELTSPTVTDVLSLCCLLPVRPLTSRGVASVANRRPAWSRPCHHLQCRRNPHKGEERPVGPRSLPLLGSSISFSLCNLLLPFVYKRGSWTSLEGGGSPLYMVVDIKTHALTCHRSTRTPETWDMSLSRLFVTPIINFQC